MIHVLYIYIYTCSTYMYSMIHIYTHNVYVIHDIHTRLCRCAGPGSHGGLTAQARARFCPQLYRSVQYC